MTLPPVLTSRDLPDAELRAMRLDGEVYALAGAWCAMDELEDVRHRITAVRANRSSRLIAELGTAAWIWGASADLPGPLEFCVGLDARARPARSSEVHVRELVLDPADLVEGESGAVTTPLRTAVDLARFRAELSAEEQSAIVTLAAIGGFDLGQCDALLDRRRNLPGKLRARERLRSLLSPR
jgi:hypothetical protein